MFIFACVLNKFWAKENFTDLENRKEVNVDFIN